MTRKNFEKKIRYRLKADFNDMEEDIELYDSENESTLRNGINAYVAYKVFQCVTDKDEMHYALHGLTEEQAVALLTEYNLGREVVGGICKTVSVKLEEMVKAELAHELAKQADVCKHRLTIEGK